jgi:endonuclease YncB( thermonuclease family)
MNMLNQLAVGLLPWLMLLQFESNTLSGTVVQVHDGDSFTLKTADQLYKVRLANIYAPQMSQLFGRQSKQYLESLVLNRQVGLDIKMFDTFGRVVGDVKLADGRWVNDEMVAAGLAWHYRITHPEKVHLAKLEHQAFTERLGLWIQNDPVPPWEITRERIIPPAPLNDSQVDYDRIFHYGILGDRRTRTYIFPECDHYSQVDYRKMEVFRTILEAESFGLRVSRGCHQ